MTALGAGRVCDEQKFVRSAAVGCITVPSGAGKMEIPVKSIHAHSSPTAETTTSNTNHFVRLADRVTPESP